MWRVHSYAEYSLVETLICVEVAVSAYYVKQVLKE